MVAGAHCAYTCCVFYVVLLEWVVCAWEASLGSIIMYGVGCGLAPVCFCNSGAGYYNMLYCWQVYTIEFRALTLIIDQHTHMGCVGFVFMM